MDLKKRFKNFVTSIKEEDNICIAYHAYCADGLCSALITTKAIERINKIKINKIIAHTSYEITQELVDFFIKNKIKKAIFTDLSLDIKPEMIKKLELIAEILIIDHHQFKNNLDSDKTIFVHASIVKSEIDSSKYPASKLAYDLFSELTNIEDLDWASCIGLISDMGYETWKEFVKKTLKKYKAKPNENIMKTEIGKAKALLSIAMMQLTTDSNKIFKIAYETRDYKDILKNQEFNELQDEVTKEIDYWIENRNKSEKYNSLIIYEIKPKMFISSTLATVLSTDYFKDMTLILISDIKDDKLTINSRNQTGKINLNDFLREVVKDLPESRAGGHIPAAGGQIRKQDINIFKKRLIELHEKYLK